MGIFAIINAFSGVISFLVFIGVIVILFDLPFFLLIKYFVFQNKKINKNFIYWVYGILNTLLFSAIFIFIFGEKIEDVLVLKYMMQVRVVTTVSFSIFVPIGAFIVQYIHKRNQFHYSDHEKNYFLISNIVLFIAWLPFNVLTYGYVVISLAGMW